MSLMAVEAWQAAKELFALTETGAHDLRTRSTRNLGLYSVDFSVDGERYFASADGTSIRIGRTRDHFQDWVFFIAADELRAGWHGEPSAAHEPWAQNAYAHFIDRIRNGDPVCGRIWTPRATIPPLDPDTDHFFWPVAS